MSGGLHRKQIEIRLTFILLVSDIFPDFTSGLVQQFLKDCKNSIYLKA